MTFAARPRFKNGKVQTFWPDWRLYQYAAWSKTKWENFSSYFTKTHIIYSYKILKRRVVLHKASNIRKEHLIQFPRQSIFVLVFTFDLYLYLSFATEGQEPRKEEGDWVPVVSIGNRFLRLRKPPPSPYLPTPFINKSYDKILFVQLQTIMIHAKKDKKNVMLLAPDSLVHHV